MRRWAPSLAWGILAALLGGGLVLFDDFLDHSRDWPRLQAVAEAVELLVFTGGLGALAFCMSAYLQGRADLQRVGRLDERERHLRLLGHLAASLAHEVRNPLHNLRLLIEDLGSRHAPVRNDPLFDRLAPNLGRIDAAVEAVYGIAFAGGRPAVEIEADAAAVVDASVAALARTGLRVQLDGCPQARVGCHPAALRLMTDNLLRNAAEAVAADGDAAAITVRCLVQAGGWTLLVLNRGALLPVIAGGADPAPSTKHAGPGLGLFLVRELAADCGGTLALAVRGDQVESRLDLPLAR